MSEKTLLVTGGYGFIGSNFIHMLNKLCPEIHIVNVDSITYAADDKNLEGLYHPEKHEHKKIDLCDNKQLEQLFDSHSFDGIIHFAAESHVDNSITGPSAFIKTNILGTFHLLECARKQWLDSPHEIKKNKTHCRFHHISTDEVYGTLGDTGLFTEHTPYAPNSPYSASKASSDHLVRSYFHTYGLNIVTTNCSNNYGPRQHQEKLIPTIIRKALSGQAIPIYGNGKNIRDWLYVEDHCQGIWEVFKNARSGETYNIGGNCEKDNLSLCKEICQILDQSHPHPEGIGYESLISFVQDRPGHDWRYAIDTSKIKKDLNWQPKVELSSGLERTIKWYLDKQISS